ncbi:MAG: ferritin family protein [Candidatus Marinimicrobia bacterium]|nr:ferritin family protein [Candidatus Neomarinimicrobiota bacterium]
MELYSVQDIIEYGIQIEKESFAFYTKASEIVKDDEVKELVKLLASEEVDHQNRLKGLIDEQKVSAEELDRELELDETLMDRIIQTEEITAQSTSMDVLNVAFEREKNTMETYTMLSTLSNIEGDILDIFEDLRLQEKGHMNKIQYRIDLLNKGAKA